MLKCQSLTLFLPTIIVEMGPRYRWKIVKIQQWILPSPSQDLFKGEKATPYHFPSDVFMIEICGRVQSTTTSSVYCACGVEFWSVYYIHSRAQITFTRNAVVKGSSSLTLCCTVAYMTSGFRRTRVCVKYWCSESSSSYLCSTGSSPIEVSTAYI